MQWLWIFLLYFDLIYNYLSIHYLQKQFDGKGDKMQMHILYASFDNIIAQNYLRLIRSGGGRTVFNVCQKQIFIVIYDWQL